MQIDANKKIKKANKFNSIQLFVNLRYFSLKKIIKKCIIILIFFFLTIFFIVNENN